MISRTLAIIPAVWIVSARGASSVTELANMIQVVLCLFLPMALLPLLYFTSSRKIMGPRVNRKLTLVLGWGSTLLITGLDIYSLPESLRTGWRIISGN